ncbi:unnamed protein product [Peronospora effusa]|nr:unnamed protein product [Peronospora effusa]
MGSPNSKMEGGDTAARLSTNSERSSFDSTSSQNIIIFDESGDEHAPIKLIEDHYAARTEQQKSQEESSVQTQVFRSEDVDGSVVTKTVRTTRMTTRSESGDFDTTIEVQTTTETETKDGIKSTSVTTETSTETVASQGTMFMKEGSVESDVQMQVFRTVEEDDNFVTKTVRTPRRTVLMDDVATTTIEVETTTETEKKDGAKKTSVSTEIRTEAGGNNSYHCIDLGNEEKTSLFPASQDATVDLAENEEGSHRPFLFRKQHKWCPQFVTYLDRHNKRIEMLSTTDFLQTAREFCRENLAEFRPELFDCGSMEANMEYYGKVAQLADHYPIVAVQMLAQDFNDKNVLIVDEHSHAFDSNNHLHKEVAVSMLWRSKSDACKVFDVLLVLKGGDVVYHGAGEEIEEYFRDLGYYCAPGQQVAQLLLSLAAEEGDRYRITVPSSRLHGTFSHFIKPFVLMKVANDTALIARGDTTYARQPTIDITPCQNKCASSTDHHIIAASPNVVAAVNVPEQTGAAPGGSMKTEVFRSEESDGSIVTKTVRTTIHTVKSDTGALVTTIDVETTTETESRDGTMSTTVAIRSDKETATEASRLTTTSATSAAAVNVTEQTGTLLDEPVKMEVFRSEESDGSIVTKTVRTTIHTEKSDTGALVTTIDVKTTTETESRDGTMSTTVATRSDKEIEETTTTRTICSEVTTASTENPEKTTAFSTVASAPFTEETKKTIKFIMETSEEVHEKPSSQNMAKTEETTTITTVTEMTSVPFTEEVEETTTFTTETLEVVPARSIDKLEDITMETTETTETSEMLSEEPSTKDMAKTEGTATETSEVEHEEPPTQDMAKTEETTTITTVTEMTSVPSTEEVEETTTFTTETLEVVPARSIDKLEDITMETTETTETSEMLSEEPSTQGYGED